MEEDLETIMSRPIMADEFRKVVESERNGFRCGTCEEETQPDIKAFYFRMVKKGNGWKTTGMFVRDGDKIPPNSEWVVNENVPLSYSTLSNIKKTFSETVPLTYVLENHLSAPSEIYQVVVKFRYNVDRKEREGLWKGVKETLCYDAHYRYKYVNDVPKKVFASWGF